MIAVRFNTAEVHIEGDLIVATFRDGKVNEMNMAWLDTPGYHAIAEEMGYIDFRQYAIEHELTHHFMADKLWMDHSWSVYENTQYSPPWPSHIAWEEHLVNQWQRFARTSHLDQQLMIVFGDRLYPYTHELKALYESVLPGPES